MHVAQYPRALGGDGSIQRHGNVDIAVEAVGGRQRVHGNERVGVVITENPAPDLDVLHEHRDAGLVAACGNERDAEVPGHGECVRMVCAEVEAAAL